MKSFKKEESRMKKIMKYTLVLLAGLSISLSCSKIDEKNDVMNPHGEDVATSVEGKQITICAKLPDAVTRVEYALDETGSKPKLTLTWESDDVLVVSNASGSVELGNPTIDETGKTATFTGVLPEGGAPYKVSVKHAGSNMGDTQTQASDGDLTHLEYAAMAENVTEEDFDDLVLSQTTGVLGLIAKIPTDVSANVKAVVFQTENNLFNGSNKLTVKLTNAGAGTDNILYVYANIAAEAIPAGTEMFIRFKVGDGDYDYYTRYQKFDAAVSLNNGALNGLKLNCSHIDRYAGKDDDGTSAAPYLIADKYQMDAMHQLMVRGEKKYFKLIDNVDMTGIVWFPLNNGYPESGGTKFTGNVYDKQLDFDGNNHEISNITTTSNPTTSDEYASVFGVLMGNVYDLTIDHATIYPKGKSGILAGYVGTATYGPNHCEVRNVLIKNSKLENGGDFCGTLAGQSAKNGNVFSNITISDCSVSTVGYAAGFLAYFANTANVSDIIVSNTDITSSGDSNASAIPNDGIAGGIAARVNAAVDFDRCSYSNGTILGPTLHDNDKSKLNRFIGGLVGRVDNKAASFDDCHVNNLTIGLLDAPANNNSRYVGGAFGYLGSAATVGNTTGCTVEGLATNNNVRNYVGGFVSFLDGATVKNSTATSESAIGNNQYSGAVGGFVGYCVGGTLYNDSASVDITGAGNPGGFVGWIETTAASIEKCSASGSVAAGANNAGGFCGIDKIGATFTECSSSGPVTSTAGYVGGLIGYINADGATIKNCFSTSTVTASGNYVGGLVGVAESDTIEESYYDGTVTGNSRVGGILGIGLKDDATIIKNCYSRGKVVGSATEQRYGGIVGDLGKGGVVENCWSDAEVTGGRVLGGIVGLACYQTWGDQTVANNTITGCIAWNPKVIAAQAGNYGSSGAVIGHTSFKNVFGNGYRRPDMQYKNSYSCSGGEWNTTMVDQPNCDGTNWAKGTTPGTKAGYTYQQPYYGTAAASTATVSSIAQSLGWSGDVWDFSGALPQLTWAME
jgi:hypothetical protein